MRYFHLLCLMCFLYSCNENKTPTGIFKDITRKEVHKDPRTKAERERDSIGMVNRMNIYEVKKNAPVIDPKKIEGAFFNKLDFNKVVAYSYDGQRSVIIEDSRAIDNQIALTQKQANTILSLLSCKNTFDTYAAGCFEPRLALVLYNDQSSILQISICMDCNRIDSDPQIDAIDGGLSKKGRKGIISFCKELKFPYGALKE